MDNAGYDNVDTDDSTREVLSNIILDASNPTENLTISANEDSAQLGFSSGSAGDVNGDGYEDIIIGAPGHDAGEGAGANRGQVYIYYGGPDMDNIADVTMSGDEDAALAVIELRALGVHARRVDSRKRKRA